MNEWVDGMEWKSERSTGPEYDTVVGTVKSYSVTSRTLFDRLMELYGMTMLDSDESNKTYFDWT